jgi:hypothetical protein
MQLSHEESVVFASSKGPRTSSERARSEDIATLGGIPEVQKFSETICQRCVFRPADVS